MSASEKLKALGAEMTPGTWGWDERVVNAHNSVYYLTGTVSDIADDVASIAALRNALPQIVAVVEAAERVDRFRSQYERAMIELGWTFGDVLAMTHAHDALAALDKALA